MRRLLAVVFACLAALALSGCFYALDGSLVKVRDGAVDDADGGADNAAASPDAVDQDASAGD
ncbi:MAG: hypothetical protein CSB49_05715 [Proteobacteria bacterium]|nr:MAG: hypothetical protein CSB49_05715 [Pseudomonadota bacterium]